MSKSIKTQVLDFVAANGAMRRTDIVRFIVEKIHNRAFNPVNDRGYYCGPFGGRRAYFMYPSSADTRYLKRIAEGLYEVCNN